MITKEKVFGIEEHDNEFNVLGKVITRGSLAVTGAAAVSMELMNRLAGNDLPSVRTILGGAAVAAAGVILDKAESWSLRNWQRK